jgi:hypothetical protein
LLRLDFRLIFGFAKQADGLTPAIEYTTPVEQSQRCPPYGIGEMGTAGAALPELSGIMLVVETAELALPDDYPHLLAELKAQIRSCAVDRRASGQHRAHRAVLGNSKAILDRQNAAGWGAKVID